MKRVAPGEIHIVRTPFAEIMIKAGVTQVHGDVADVISVRMFQDEKAEVFSSQSPAMVDVRIVKGKEKG